jgi:protein CpxP
MRYVLSAFVKVLEFSGNILPLRASDNKKQLEGIYNKEKGCTMQRVKSYTTTIVALLAVIVIASSLGLSQRMSVEERVKVLKDSLKLSDDQVTKITKILEDQREEMTTAREEHRGDRDAMRAVIEEMMKKTDDKIKGVLNADQASKYEEMMKQRRANMGRRARGG